MKKKIKKTANIFKEDYQEIKKMVKGQKIEDLLMYLLSLQEFLFVKTNSINESITFEFHIQEGNIFADDDGKGIKEEHHGDGTYTTHTSSEYGGWEPEDFFQL